MRVLHIAQAAGGVEIYLQALIRGLIKKGIECGLICDTGYNADSFQQLGCSVWVVPMSRSLNPIKHTKIIKKIKSILDKNRPDVVYCHSSFAGVTGRLAARNSKCKILYNPHGWSFDQKLPLFKKKTYILIERYFATFTDKIVCISDFERKSALKEHIAPKQKFTTIFNGIDVQKIKKSTLSINSHNNTIPSSSFVIGMIGRLCPQKAPDAFVKMSRLIKDKIPNAFFVIVGDGSDRKKIEQEIQLANLNDSFLITGWINHPYSYLARFNIGVLLSRWEGFGLAITEYMAAQKPVVATKAGGIPNLIIDDFNGSLVDIDDYKAASEAVIRIYEDKNLRIKFINNSYNIVRKKFSLQREIEQTYNLLMDICSYKQ